MTSLLAITLFAQQQQGQGGNGLVELIKVLAVLAFILGPALLQFFFGAKAKNAEKAVEATPPKPTLRSAMEKEIDDFVRTREGQPVAKPQRREKANRVRPARAASPATDVVAATPARALLARPLDTLESTRSGLAQNSPPVTQGVEHYVAFGNHPVAVMLHSPASLAHAVILSEVLRRPTW